MVLEKKGRKIIQEKKMNKRTQTSMRLKKDTLDKLKKLKKKTGLSMARVLALIVDDYLGEENE